MFVAGSGRARRRSWRAPVIVHGKTTANSRYLGFATDPFSRMDGEREWTLIAQAALWSKLTDGYRHPIRPRAALQSGARPSLLCGLEGFSKVAHRR